MCVCCCVCVFTSYIAATNERNGNIHRAKVLSHSLLIIARTGARGISQSATKATQPHTRLLCYYCSNGRIDTTSCSIIERRSERIRCNRRKTCPTFSGDSNRGWRRLRRRSWGTCIIIAGITTVTFVIILLISAIIVTTVRCLSKEVEQQRSSLNGRAIVITGCSETLNKVLCFSSAQRAISSSASCILPNTYITARRKRKRVRGTGNRSQASSSDRFGGAARIARCRRGMTCEGLIGKASCCVGVV